MPIVANKDLRQMFYKKSMEAQWNDWDEERQKEQIAKMNLVVNWNEPTQGR